MSEATSSRSSTAVGSSTEENAVVNNKEGKGEELEKSAHLPKHKHVMLRITTRMGAAVVVQRHWRGWKSRKESLHTAKRVNISYEIRIRELRNEKLALGNGFVNNFLLLLLLIAVFSLQHGRTVGTRFELVRALKNQMGSIKTDDGHTFDTVSSVDEIWSWTTKFFSTTSAETSGHKRSRTTRTFICTYNQVVGSVRFATTRVGSRESCAYKNSSWTQYILGQRRKKLKDSDLEQCYGSILSESDYGPWYDPGLYVFSPSTTSHYIDMPRDPIWAALSFEEMQKTEFLSMNTRSFSIAFTVYNNALPMLCYVRLVFEVTATGAYDSRYEIEAINVLEYLQSDFWLQVLLENILLLQTFVHARAQVHKVKNVIRGARRHSASVLTALRRHVLQFSVMLDLARTASYISHYAHWYMLVVDKSRDIDLETEDFVELDRIAKISHQYNTQFNVILIISLLHLLEYVGLDDRMALLTRSVASSVSDLIPFMILFVIFVCIFACIGHLLYGPVLVEWSTVSNSLRTSIDIMIGNYMFEQLQDGIPDDKPGDNLVAAIFFYIYFFLMMLITLNIIIAILMDGYASVKELDNSLVQKHVRYNVGGLTTTINIILIQPLKRTPTYKRLFGIVHHEVDPWTNEEWIHYLKDVQRLREEEGHRSPILSVGLLMAVLRRVMTKHSMSARHSNSGQAKKDLEVLADQIKLAFHNRDWYPPSDLNFPFKEPTEQSRLAHVEKTVVSMEERQRYMLYLVDQLADPGRSPGTPPAVPPEYASKRMGMDTQELLELVVSQQQTISELLANKKEQHGEPSPTAGPHRTLVRRRRKMNGTPVMPSVGTPVMPSMRMPVLPNYGSLGSISAQRAMGRTMEQLRMLSEPSRPKSPTKPKSSTKC